VETLEDRLLLATFPVTNTSDNSSTGSLRWAIGEANAAGGGVIQFQIPASGVQTIALSSALPVITVPVTIDGTSQEGYTGTPLIVLNGAVASAGFLVDGLDIAGGDSVVEGLTINQFSGNGIRLQTAGSDTIQYSYIGTDSTGSSALGNGQDGVQVANNSNDNEILHNVISGNIFDGIRLDGFDYGGSNPGGATSGNVIQGNFIGTNATGTAPLGNREYGVALRYAPDTQIGGTTPGTRNIISANGMGGVELGTFGPGDFCQLQGNYTGTDVTGTVALGSATINPFEGFGVDIFNGSNDIIGETAAGAGNVISGNPGFGISCLVAGSHNETIQGNLIGTDATGTRPLGNGGDGIAITSTTSVLIGGTVAAARNVVSDNGGAGINADEHADLTIEGN
jgi:hypothetical protein